MIYEYALLTVTPESSTDFEATFHEATDILMAADGCLSVDIQAAEDQPGVYLMKVGWQHLEDHLQTFSSSPAAVRLGEVFGTHFSAEPVVAHFAQ